VLWARTVWVGEPPVGGHDEIDSIYQQAAPKEMGARGIGQQLITGSPERIAEGLVEGFWEVGATALNIRFAVELGGKPESTVLGFGTRLPAPAAAFVNGGMAHCLDYDDFRLAGVHPSTPTVPCGIAMAERVAGTSGKALLTAIALGNDFTARLSASVADSWETGWYTTPLFGYF
jgi:hypothetical protein